MTVDPSQLPDDVTTLKALLIAAERRAAEPEKTAADAGSLGALRHDERAGVHFRQKVSHGLVTIQ